MDSIEQVVQKKLIERYRKERIWVRELTDEEVGLLCPVSDEDIKAFMAYEKGKIMAGMSQVDERIAEVKRERQDSQELLDDPHAFSEAKSEARRDISHANNKLTYLGTEKESLFRRMVELDAYERPMMTDEEIKEESAKIAALINRLEELIAKYREDVTLLERVRDNPITPVVDSKEAGNDIVYDNIRIYGFMSEKDKLTKRLKALGWDEDDKRSR